MPASTRCSDRERVQTMFKVSERSDALRAQLIDFMTENVYPNERRFWDELDTAADRWAPLPLIERLKARARSDGLWNLFLPSNGLSNLEYAPLAEVMGRVHWASVVFNCSAPDTGNMELLERFGTPEQQDRWLAPLLAGRIRSAFSMTEPAVASSDATNIRTEVRRDGDEYVINGRKWFTSGAGFRDCAVFVLMGKTDPDHPDKHRQQSMILVAKDTPGVTIERAIPVFGWDEAPYGHAEVCYDNVRVPAANLLLGEGRGFEIAQARLGPGRIHHCMRIVGSAEVAFEKMCSRLASRTAFGRPLGPQTVWQERIAEARIAIDQCRLLTLHAAHRIDTVGAKAARKEIGMIKVAAPAMLCKVVDWAIQAHGAAGVTEDFGLSYQYARARVMRIVDGPDEVHRNQIARIELAEQGLRA